MINHGDDIHGLVVQVRKEAAALSTRLMALERALNLQMGKPSDLLARSEDRRNTRRKIESDGELEQFIRERIYEQTFPAVAAAVAAQFSPARRVTISSIHRWWHRTGKHLPKAQSANPS